MKQCRICLEEDMNLIRENVKESATDFVQTVKQEAETFSTQVDGFEGMLEGVDVVDLSADHRIRDFSHVTRVGVLRA